MENVLLNTAVAAVALGLQLDLLLCWHLLHWIL